MTSSLSLLATTDFSAPARHALERAAQLAAAHPGAQLTLAHVVSASMLARLRWRTPPPSRRLCSSGFHRGGRH